MTRIVAVCARSSMAEQLPFKQTAVGSSPTGRTPILNYPMKKLIIYASTHHGNTKRVAKEMGAFLNAEVVSFSQVKREDIYNANLVGFGSGVYFRKFHEEMINLIEELPKMDGKKVFLFSTHGTSISLFNKSHSHIKKILKRKNVSIVGEFSCPGFDTYGILKLIGGINRNRPNEEDIKKARNFAKGLLEREV